MRGTSAARPDDPRSGRGLAIVLGATVVTLAVGYLIKFPCLGTPWDGRQYTMLCYSDVYALYASADRDRGLDEDRFPYVEGENEYPVLNGLAMYATALPATSNVSFFNWNVVLLGGGALVTAWALERLSGRRALFFAFAPTLAIYAFMSWDLLAVALATLATLAYLRGRAALSGALLGFGAAAKLYPALLLVPFALGLLLERRRRDAATIVVMAVVSWVAVNLPFMLLAFDGWSEFFRFNAERTADWDSVWRPLEDAFGWETGTVNIASMMAFVVAAVAIGALWWRRRAEAPAWALGFPLLVAFLLTSKVYSPQYSLWLLPWFALVLPSVGWFAAFELADAAVFVTRFQFFARLADVGTGVSEGAFQAALVLRGAVLVGCVLAWLARRSPDRRPLPDRAAA